MSPKAPLKYGYTDTLPEHLSLWFDGLCEPINPGGLGCYAWSVRDGVNEVGTGRGVAAKRGSKDATNNFAEYAGLGYGLAWLVARSWRGDLAIFGDSKLVVEQISGRWQCKAERLKPLHKRCLEYLDKLGNFTATWVPREKNGHCDRLSRMAYEEHKND